jgi:succinyl-CoA synthetase beta subunit
MTMAVMDAIAAHGERAACFLDCSNNPTYEGYGAALELLRANPGVEAILISIFGGLTQVDRVARSLVRLLRERGDPLPVTLRLMGTNVEAAEAVLASAGHRNHRSLEEAVSAAVASVRRRGEEAADERAG